MKTTVQISDALLADIQKIAAKRKTTLRALVDEGLRLVVDNHRKPKKAAKMEDFSVGGKGLHADVKGKSWQDIIALSYGDRGGDGL
jgi:hypothetical protein